MNKILSLRSFKMKLLILIWGGSTATLFIACGFYIFFEISEFDKNLVKQINIISNFIADKSAPAIMLNDPAIAEYALLSAVETEPAIVYAVIYDIKANVIATYVSDIPGSKEFKIPEPEQNVSFVKNEQLHYFSDIRMYSDRIGIIYLRVERQELYKRIQRYGIIVVGIMVVTLLLMTIISFFLQKFITAPVMVLINSAKKVSEKKDYTIRVKKQNNDELDVLVDAFNEMLEQIEKRDDALRKSEEQYRILLNTQTDLVIKVDTEGRFLFVNPSYCEAFGKSEEELIGQSFMPLVHEEDREQMAKEIEKLYQPPYNVTLQHRAMTQNGWRWFEWVDTAILDDDGNVNKIIGVGRDIDDRILGNQENEKLLKRLNQSQKMEAIGTLAGGIAHDFNNILFPIMGHSEMLMADFHEDSKVRDSLEQIFTAAVRAKKLVQQILTFSRQESHEITLVKIQPIIEEALKLIRSTIPTTINIKQNINSECGTVKADPTQIHQLIMNLTTNAYHAIEDSDGELEVTLREIELSEHDEITSDLEPGVYACLTVSDTGMGMDKKLVEKIFNPFFTTKEMGKGTGMGLSVALGVVKNAGGGIYVYSEPGIGTKINVFLPVVKDLTEQQEILRKESIQVGIERILLVDDEDGILIMEKRLLTRLGYHVTSFSNSINALEAFRSNPGEFDLVITDMAMPELSGDKLSIELLKIRTDIPILICTGFSETISEEKAVSMGIRGFLMKPVIIKELAEKIREMLN